MTLGSLEHLSKLAPAPRRGLFFSESGLSDKHYGLPVAGYKPQPQVNVELVNRNKEIEERVLRILDELRELPGVDGRWLAIGRTDIEKGFMAVNRAVFQPGRAKLPEDK